MNIPLIFIRIFFFIIGVLSATAFAISAFPENLPYYNSLIGLTGGAIFCGVVIGIEALFKRFNLRTFNLALMGLFFGYLMGETLVLFFKTFLESFNYNMSKESLAICKIAIILFSGYFGIVMTIRSADELYFSIPFFKFKPSYQRKRDILLDISILTDPRIIDLATSGLLDHHLILPRFALKELYQLAESNDEVTKNKARRSLDVVKKLEGIPNLEMRYIDTDFVDVRDPQTKLTHLARHLDANIITADISRVQQSEFEGVRVININSLSNALKPITSSGEFLNIKVQRYGKEPRQGIGYLEDGTMVVVNGGAEFIGENIKAQVLSVKHTSSGRMIFCNASEEGYLNDQEIHQTVKNLESAHKNFFAV